jgi:ribose 5-phosphate isomerase A
MDMTALKREAAARALDQVRAGMRLGLGTGSTAREFVDLLGARVRDGLDVLCVATSEATETQARGLGIPMSTLDETPELDLVVDGADEIGPGLTLIKGGGGAHLREKIVATASRRMIVIADDSKVVPVLGRFALPVEVVPFGRTATENAIRGVLDRLGLAGQARLRLDRAGHVFVTDGGHHILDLPLGTIPDPVRLATALDAIPGVVEHGLFIDLADEAIVATPDGVRIISRPTGGPRS